MATCNVDAFDMKERAGSLTEQVARAMQYYKEFKAYRSDKEYKNRVDACQKPFEELANYLEERCK